MSRKHKKTSFGSVIKSITGGIKQIEQPVADVYKTGFKEAGSVSNNLIKTSGGVLNSLGLPLLVIGGVVLIVMIRSK